MKTIKTICFFLFLTGFSNIIYPEFLNLVGKDISFFLDSQSGAFYAENPNPSTRLSQQYLFKDLPPTSYITFIVNGKPYQIHETSVVSIIKPFQSDENKILCTFKIETLVLNLAFLITNLDGKNFNSIICLIKIKNDGPNQAIAGARFLFDTVYGESERRISLYLSSKEKIEYDRLMNKENMPQFLFSGIYDGDTGEFGKGLYIYPSINEIRPEKVIVGNWKKLDEKELSYELAPLARFKYNAFANPDAAVAVYFNNIYIKSGEEVSFGTVLSATKLQPVSLKLSEAVTEITPYNVNTKTSYTGTSQINQSITGQETISLKNQLDVYEKLASLLDKLDLFLSNKSSSLQKGLEKSVVKSAYGDPFENSNQEKNKSKYQETNASIIIPSYIFTNEETGEETNQLKKDVSRLQKLYDAKIAALKKFYEELIKKQETEFKKLSSGYKEKVDKKNKSKKIEDVNDTIIQIDKKIGVIEELLKLNLDFEGMPPDKLDDIEKRIKDIEIKLK